MNVIFTCGGTAGHVNPALALARYFQQKDPAAKVLFVGTPNGMERGLVEKAGYDFAAVEVSNFRRSLSPEGLRHNFKTARTLVTSRREADAIIRDFKPDLVVGTGGQLSRRQGRGAPPHPHRRARVQHDPRPDHQAAGGLRGLRDGGVRGLPPPL